MSWFSNFFSRIRNSTSRRQRDQEWGERFTNDPNNPPRGRLPLDDETPNSHLR